MKALPDSGWSRGDIDAALTSFAGQDSRWKEGRVPLYVFGGEAEVGVTIEALLSREARL